MKNFIKLFILFNIIKINNTYADIFGNSGILKSGDAGWDTIPSMLRIGITTFMGIAGTVSVLFIIIGAYQIMYGATAGDKTKGRNTVIAAIGGFVLAALGGVIVNLILNNLT